MRRWLFFHEMVDRFTEPIAKALRDHKLNEPKLKVSEVRFHPELPEQEAGL